MQTTIDNYVGTRTFDAFVRTSEAAREAGHQYWINDIPVTQELLAFYKAIKAKRFNIVPRVDFLALALSSLSADNGLMLYNRIGITYADTTAFTSGNIFTGTNKSGVTEYSVDSKSICNEKYVYNSDGYNVRKSKDMAKALKVALKHLTPMTYSDIVKESTGYLNTAISNLRQPAREKWSEVFHLPRDEVVEEMEYMLSVGYTPRSEAFKKAIDLIVSEGAELKRMREYKPRACFVWIKPTSLTYKFTDEQTQTECTDPLMVPELIRNKVAILQIASKGSAIADVGVRVSDTTYWVFA